MVPEILPGDGFCDEDAEDEDEEELGILGVRLLVVITMLLQSSYKAVDCIITMLGSSVVVWRLDQLRVAFFENGSHILKDYHDAFRKSLVLNF